MDFSSVLRYVPVTVAIIQIIGFIILWVNTNSMAKDPNAQPYYNANVASSVLVSIPLLVSLIILSGSTGLELVSLVRNR